MKVLQLISSSGLYGAERVLLELACHLHSAPQVEVCVGALVHPGDQAEPAVLVEARALGLAVRGFPCSGALDPTLPLRLGRHLRRDNVDLLHCHNYKSDIYGYLGAARSQTRLVATCHNWLTEGLKLRAFEAADKWILGRFDQVVAVSADILQELQEGGVRSAGRIDNGMHVEPLGGLEERLAARRSLGLGPEAKVLVSVGRMDRWKAHHVQMHALDRVRRHNVDAHLVLVGEGERRQELESLREQLGLWERVHFTGYLDDIRPALAAADIFVLSSIKEGLPMVLLEAMGAGLPVVASGVGGIPEALALGKAGVIVSPGCADGLCAGVLTLLEDDSARREKGAAGRARYLERYSREAMGKRYLDLYRGLLNA